ncbi:MAG: hypothetical protein DMG72_05640 [Acidobacteria bacterium]|nr:MAG: hypothetical protein DMG72_05640 [Acidobacteriota bacterium]
MQLACNSRFLSQVTVAALVAATALTAQEMPAKNPAPIGPKEQLHRKTAKPKLTPPQKLGLRLLNSAQFEAAGLQPDMRAFVLWQASHGYTKIDPAKADALLKDAFRVTLSVESSQAESRDCSEVEFCGVKYWLQKQILQEMIKRAKRISEIQPWLASAEPEVRQRLSPDVFRRYLHEKAFDQARDLLGQMADEDGYFSYGGARELMDALPPERSKDRITIFSQALDSYRQHTDERYPAFDDLATMVLRFWQDLPPSLVLEAVDQIFDRAKDADAKRADEGQQNIPVGISANKGDAYFSSTYQFRLYELMPVLEQLDKDRAESFMRDNSEIHAALERYPQGLASMNALPNQSDGRHRLGILSIGTVDTTQAAAGEMLHELSRRQNRIVSEAEKDPKQALSDAMGLPLSLESGFSPRASTLSSLARIVASKNPDLSKAALGEIRKIAENTPAHNQAGILAELPEIYLRLGDQDAARSSLNELVKIAVKLYSRDSDSDDPNQAFKAMWPSANLWRHCVQVAAKLAPSVAEEIIEEVPDADIKTFERITFANTLLGADTPPISIIEKHKNGMSAFIQ